VLQSLCNLYKIRTLFEEKGTPKGSFCALYVESPRILKLAAVGIFLRLLGDSC
jgi:hypothetical protein